MGSGSDRIKGVELFLKMEQSFSTNTRSIRLIIPQAGINAALIRQSEERVCKYYIVYVDM